MVNRVTEKGSVSWELILSQTTSYHHTIGILLQTGKWNDFRRLKEMIYEIEL